MLQTDHYRRFERVDRVEETPRGVVAELHGERLAVEVVTAGLVRLRISRGGAFDDPPTYAVCVDPFEEPARFEVARDDERVRVVTAELTVSVWLDPFRVDVHRADGTPVVETAADEQGRYWAYATLNDSWTVRRRCRRDDAFFGLGEKGGRHNRKGRDFLMWNTDVLSPHETAEFTVDKEPGDLRGDRTSTEFDPYYVSVPFFYHQAHPSLAMSGSFVDNGYRSTFELSGSEEYRFGAAGGQYVEYVFAGPDMAAILADYTWLTGRMPLPPLWALGYHQCRWLAYSGEDVERLGRRLRAEGIPCDVLWLDIEYMDGYRVFTWHPERFPDPAAMLERLADDGFRTITIIDPGVKYEPGYWVFDQGVERDLFCRTEGGDTYIGQVWPGDTAFPDFVTEEARAWWGELNAAHVRSGLAGIWNDMNEPATGSIPALPMRFDHGRQVHERYRNQYALLMAMGTVAGLRESMPDRRTFVLSRAGFAGIQRYAANWMGDNQSRWDHLWVSITMGCGFGVSGQPFVGADVGGFAGNADGELLVRWTQYAALTPFFRNHTELSTIDQYPWAFGEVVLGHVREAIRLRYRLLPYLYAAFVRAAETGEPVQRPLVLDHQYDAAVRDLDDEFLCGRDLLVAPVTAPGMTARQVYLPAGDWHDWHTGEVVRGPAYVVAATPMDRIPLYARGGAVVPMWGEPPASTAGYHPREVELHVFVPAADGSWESVLAEDDGLTFAAADGGHLRTTVTLTRAGDRVDVRAAVSGDGFPEFAREAFRVVVHGASPTRLVLADGTEVAAVDGAHTVTDRGEGFELSFEV